jgi:hypothetical protein
MEDAMERNDALVAPGWGSNVDGDEASRPLNRDSGPGLDGSDGHAPTAGNGRAKRMTRRPDLRKDLRDFASGRPQGWEHEDWLNFLESLQNRGHDIRDREAIGVALEKERLDLALSGVKGIGPQKRAALIEAYGTLWALRKADASEIAAAGGLTSSLAERIKTEVG